jgi:hypothetical protein
VDAPERVVSESLALFQDLFPDVSARPNATLGLRFALTPMSALAVEQILQPEGTPHARGDAGLDEAFRPHAGTGSGGLNPGRFRADR